MRYPTFFLTRGMIVLLLVSAVLVLDGCRTTPPKASFYATERSLYMEPNPPKMQSFGPGEIACLVIDGYSGQAVTVHIVDMLTGQTVQTRTTYIPEGRINVMPFDLPPGSYLAELSISGVNVATWKFKIAGTGEKPANTAPQ